MVAAKGLDLGDRPHDLLDVRCKQDLPGNGLDADPAMYYMSIDSARSTKTIVTFFGSQCDTLLHATRQSLRCHWCFTDCILQIAELGTLILYSFTKTWKFIDFGYGFVVKV